MKSPFLVLKKECDEAVRWVSGSLVQAGLQVVQTFDLHTARSDQGECSCPHHGTDLCNCQMVVLLVYGNEFPPASLVAHGLDGQTWFMLVDTPQQSMHPGLEAAVLDALTPHFTNGCLTGTAAAPSRPQG